MGAFLCSGRTARVYCVNVTYANRIPYTTGAFKRGHKENSWDCSDCVDIKLWGVNSVSIQALIDMVMAL